MFRLLGLHPGPDIAAAAAASLAGLARARRAAATRGAGQGEPAHEQCPWPVRAARPAARLRRQPVRGERAARRGAAGSGLLPAHGAGRGRARLPGSAAAATAGPAPATTPERLAGPDQAVAWLQAEHQVLLAAAGAAAGSGFPAHAWQLPAVLRTYLARHGHYLDWAQAQRTALAAAVQLGNHSAEASARLGLGEALMQLGSWARPAITWPALALSRQLATRRPAACHCHIALLCARPAETIARRSIMPGTRSASTVPEPLPGHAGGCAERGRLVLCATRRLPASAYLLRESA